MPVSYLNRTDAPMLAYQYQAGDTSKPAVMFLTGLASDMTGTKAQHCADVCLKAGVGFVRFDFRGHGQSGGGFEEGMIGLWLCDALDILDSVLADYAAVVLVGSSMGGWVALLTAIKRPDKVSGLIGLAAAPDFTWDMEEKMTPDQKQALDQTGAFFLPAGEYGFGYTITRELLDDGRQHALLHAEVPIECPVCLIQGECDDVVLPDKAVQIYENLKTPNKTLILRKDGDHRLSSPEDLEILSQKMLELIQAARK